MFRSRSKGGRSGVVGSLTWVAGLAAVGVLTIEVGRRSRQDSSVGFLGGLLIAYLIYAATSIRYFWPMPRIAIPTTMLIGGTLWTIMLHSIERSATVPALAAIVLIPIVTASALWLIFSRPAESPGVDESLARASLIQSLLNRGVGFGERANRV